jgi:hypothetical protein
MDFLPPGNCSLFAYPLTDNSGLGNILFPWARAVIWAQKWGARLVKPAWGQIRIGPFLRGDRDKRRYGKQFTGGDCVSGLAKRILLATSQVVSEDQVASLTPARRLVVTFKGMRNRFVDLLGSEQVVRESLLQIINPALIPRRPASPIAIHVRRGDFIPPANADELRAGNHNRLIPDEWYIAVLRNIRSALGENVPATVYSDAKPKLLEQILSQPNTVCKSSGVAVTDLLELAGSGVLIASASTFSEWASYLGQMPVIWYEGQLRTQLYRGTSSAGLETEATPDGSLDQAWLKKLNTEGSLRNPIAHQGTT